MEHLDPTAERATWRFVVAAGSRADGAIIRDLPISERTWISLVIRDGEPLQARGAHAFDPGAEVHVLTKTSDAPALRRLFEEPIPRESER